MAPYDYLRLAYESRKVYKDRLLSAFTV